MSESAYWDDSEFNFFETLEDEDKLLYLYDLMIGDFSHMEINGEDLDRLEQQNELGEMFRQLGEAAFEMDNEEDDESEMWDLETDRSEVKVEFINGLDNYIKISGPTLDVLLKVGNDLQMNGMILVDKKVEFTKYEPWGVILTYKLIGNCPPFSVN